MGMLSQQYATLVEHVLLGANYNDKLALLRKTPISPPNGGATMVIQPVQMPDGTTQDPRQTPYSVLRIAELADMIGFIKLAPAGGAATGALTFEVKTARQLPDAAARAGRVPCWYLPWQSAHLMHLHITNISTAQLNFGGAIASEPNPSLFFTAAINGCSVFAVGNPKTPEVYHGGIDGDAAPPMPIQGNDTTEETWQRLIGPAVGAGGVGRSDYIYELKSNHANNTDRLTYKGGKTTAAAMRLQQLLESRGNLTKITVAAWGAVFGLRDAGGDWHFNLVKNATTQYDRVHYTKTTTAVEKRFLRPNKITTTTSEIQHGGLIVLDDSVKRLEVPMLTCVNLGYKEFFPGVGVEHIRDPKTIVIN